MYNFPLHINKNAFPPCTTTDLFRPTKAQRSITSCYTLFKLFIINENRHVIVGSSHVFDNFTPDIVQYFQYSLNSSKVSCERRNKMKYVQQPLPCSLVSQYFQYLRTDFSFLLQSPVPHQTRPSAYAGCWAAYS